MDDAAVTAIHERVEQAFDEGLDFAHAPHSPSPATCRRAVWVEDGYWRSEPGRGGGTEAG